MEEGLTDTQRDEIHAEILAGRKIQAIKLYREATGQGLYESKQAVEAMESQIPADAPGRLAARQRTKGGCMPVLVLLLSLAILSAWGWA